MRTGTLRLAFAACLLAAGASWVGPSLAFDSAEVGARSVAASVVADADAYNAPILLPCSVPADAGGACGFAIFNNATSNQTYTVTLQSDASGVVSGFDVDGNAASGGAATGNLVTVGQKSTVTATISACVACGSTTVEWMIAGETPNVLDSRQERVALTVQFV